MLLESPKVCAHLQYLPRDADHHFVRLFAGPPGEIEPESGQPWKPYIAPLLLSVRGDEAEVGGAVTLPSYALPLLRRAARRLEVTRLKWQSWDDVHRLKLPPVFLEL